MQFTAAYRATTRIHPINSFSGHTHTHTGARVHSIIVVIIIFVASISIGINYLFVCRAENTIYLENCSVALHEHSDNLVFLVDVPMGVEWFYTATECNKMTKFGRISAPAKQPQPCWVWTMFLSVFSFRSLAVAATRCVVTWHWLRQHRIVWVSAGVSLMMSM